MLYLRIIPLLCPLQVVHKQVAADESEVIFHMLNMNKQATKICFSKPQKLYFGEEVSSSPDNSEKTVSIFLLRLN